MIEGLIFCFKSLDREYQVLNTIFFSFHLFVYNIIHRVNTYDLPVLYSISCPLFSFDFRSLIEIFIFFIFGWMLSSSNKIDFLSMNGQSKMNTNFSSKTGSFVPSSHCSLLQNEYYCGSFKWANIHVRSYSFNHFSHSEIQAQKSLRE